MGPSEAWYEGKRKCSLLNLNVRIGATLMYSAGYQARLVPAHCTATSTNLILYIASATNTHHTHTKAPLLSSTDQALPTHTHTPPATRDNTVQRARSCNTRVTASTLQSALMELHHNRLKYNAVLVQHCISLHGCRRRSPHCRGVVHAQSGGKLWLLFQAVVLDQQLLECLSPLHHVKVIVSTFLVVGGLDARLDARGSGDPHLLLLVVSPVTIVPERRVEGGRRGGRGGERRVRWCERRRGRWEGSKVVGGEGKGSGRGGRGRWEGREREVGREGEGSGRGGRVVGREGEGVGREKVQCG